MKQGAEKSPPPTNDIEVKIRDFVARNILFTEQGFPHDDSASFLETGVIDSLGVLELVTFAGTHFGLEVDPSEVTPENFDSVSRLSAFIRKKQKQVQNGCVSS